MTYSVKQLANILELNEETIRGWIREKKLISNSSGIKGSNIYIEESDIDFLWKTLNLNIIKIGN